MERGRGFKVAPQKMSQMTTSTTSVICPLYRQASSRVARNGFSRDSTDAMSSASTSRREHQEHHGLGHARAEIKTRLLGHVAILAPGFRVSDWLGDISGIGQLPHCRQERQGHQGNHLSGCRAANRGPSGRRSPNRPLVAGKPGPQHVARDRSVSCGPFMHWLGASFDSTS